MFKRAAKVVLLVVHQTRFSSTPAAAPRGERGLRGRSSGRFCTEWRCSVIARWRGRGAFVLDCRKCNTLLLA